MTSRHRLLEAASLMVTVRVLCSVAVVFLCVQPALSQDRTQTNAALRAEVQGGTSDFVTINVDDGSIAQVLNAFSRQTGKSIVIGPEVNGNVTVRLKNIRWDEALNTILQPYGYGYYMMGETVVVVSRDRLPSAQDRVITNGVATAGGEPLLTKVINLKFLDASDVEEMIKSQLSPSGRVSKLTNRSQSWRTDGANYGLASNRGFSPSGSSAEGVGRLRRVAEEKDLAKSSTLIVTDTQPVISRISSIIADIDQMPIQVLIDARFIEVESDFLRDIGFEFGTGSTGAERPGVQMTTRTAGDEVLGLGGQQISGTARPGNFLPQGTISSTRPFDTGLSLVFQQLTDTQFQILLHALQEDVSYNVLSSPSILTLNNQDATIIVGTKFPIINSQTTAGGVDSSTTSTSLEYYENVGIQLRVLPQVCDNRFINLIVHPSVREIVSTESGRVGTGNANVSLTEYPVLSTREAETQIMVASGRTIVIGGLLKDKKSKSTFKVPFLGSIPVLGLLFRRDTTQTQKIDLLIFLRATIKSPGDDRDDEAVLRRMSPESLPLIESSATNRPPITRKSSFFQRSKPAVEKAAVMPAGTVAKKQ